MLTSRVARNDTPATGCAAEEVCALKHAVLHASRPDAGKVDRIASAAVIYTAYTEEYFVGVRHAVSRIVCRWARNCARASRIATRACRCRRYRA